MLRIEFENLTIRFGRRAVVEDLSTVFQWDSAAPGDRVIALMGPSGCGKTTLAREILRSRYEPGPAETARVSPDRTVIAYLPQRPVVFPHLPIMRNARLLEGVGRYRRQFDPELFAQLTERLRLSALLASDVGVDRLSGGETQRLMLLRTLSVRPDLLVLDEPAAGLDPAVRETFLIDLQELLARLGIAAIYITHHWDEVEFLARRVAFAQLASAGGQPICKLDVVPTEAFARSPPTPDAFRTVFGPGCSLWPLSDAGGGGVACFQPAERGGAGAGYRQGPGDRRLSNAVVAALEQGGAVEAALYQDGQFVGWRNLERCRLAELDA